MNDVKRPLAIVLGITDNWAFATGTVLLGLRKYKPRLDYEVIIYHQNLSDENRKLLEQIHPCSFINYDVDTITANKFKRVSKMSFSRFECFGLLDQYKKVLWLDADVLVKGDISDLVDNSPSGMAMYKHEKTPISVSFLDSIPGYDMERKCFNAGVFLVTEELVNFSEMKGWCYQKTNAWANAIHSDQAIINLLLQEFDVTVDGFDIRYNCPPLKESPQTAILHPWGDKKFWDGYIHPQWDQYYYQWLGLGGSGPAIQRGIFNRQLKIRILHREMTLRCTAYAWLSRRFSSVINKIK